MRRIAIVLAVLLACSDSDSPRADAGPDPATAHEIVDCDVASWRTIDPGLPDGTKCERACQAPVAHDGPNCLTTCGIVCPTLDYGGIDGCCEYHGAPGPFVFCECE